MGSKGHHLVLRAILCFTFRALMVSAFFIESCTQPVVVSRLHRSNSSTGPPVLFRHLSSSCRSLILVNTVLGSKGFGKFATYDKLRNSTCTTCQISVDKSAYYFPNLYYRSQ